MGAIFGVWGSVSDAELQAMGGVLAHRGKTMRVRRVTDDVAVGAAGADPDLSLLVADDLVLACDATLYNAGELQAHVRRTEAAGAGILPIEILSALYESQGPAGLARADGDYALALIDRRRGEVVLARDFFGCRPLYYSQLPDGRIAFASEYKALLVLAGMPVEVDRNMVQYLQCAKRVPVGKTLLANVAEAMPGMVTRLRRNAAPSISRSYPPLAVEVGVTDEGEAVRLVREELTAAVRRRSSDLGSIGLALSGGIDSIAVAFLLRQLHPDKEIHTFTAGYGADDPEIVTAAKVAARVGARHHEVMTPPEIMRSRLRELVWHMEDPFARSEALQLLEVGRAAREHVDVLFSAQGSDGLFAGAAKYLVFHLMRRLPIGRAGLRDLYDVTQLSLPPSTLLGMILDWLYHKGRVPPVPRVLGASMPTRASLPPVQREFVNLNMANSLQFGVCMSLHKFERTFAAAGLEHRSPFYDLALVRAAYTISDRLKIHNRTQKYILRKALATVVDDEFRDLGKFPQRMKYDLAFADALDEVAHEVLSDAAVRRRGLFEPDGIRALFRRRPGQAYAAEAAMRIWTAVLTERWARLFLDQRMSQCHPDHQPFGDGPPGGFRA